MGSALEQAELRRRIERNGLNIGRISGALSLGIWAYMKTGRYDMVGPEYMFVFFGAIGWCIGALLGALAAGLWLRFKLER